MSASGAVAATAAPFPVLPITSQRTLELCRTFTTSPLDIYVCSYPKSGTTWTQNIVYTMATRGQRPLEHISDYAPFYEIDKTWSACERDVQPSIRKNHAAIGRKIFNTHLWPDMLPSSPCKMVYLTRRGKDVVTSFYHHLFHQAPEDGGFCGNFDHFFDEWIKGDMVFGRWDVHVAKWTKFAAADPRVLLLSYEDMKEDLVGCAMRINLHCEFGLSEAEVTKLLPGFSFESMKANLDKFSPRSIKLIDRGDDFAFIRKGTVGDHKSLFLEKHHKMFDSTFGIQ